MSFDRDAFAQGRNEAFAQCWRIAGLLLIGLFGTGLTALTAQPAEPWRLAFTTLLDGQGTDAATALVMDEAGNLYVAGSTASADFPTRAALFGFQGGSVLGMDLFVAKIGPDGTPRFTTYLGGRSEDIASAIALAPDGASWSPVRRPPTTFP